MAQRLLTSRRGAWPAGKQRPSLRETRQEGLRWQESDAGGGQFQRQREPIQAHTQLGNCSCIGCRELKAGELAACPLHEESHGRRLGDALGSQVLGEIRQGKGSNGKELFGLQMQYRSARHQDRELRAEREEVLDLWRGGHDLLKVVQQQQQTLVLQKQFQEVEQWEPFELFDRKVLGDGGQEQVRVTDGGKWDEKDPIDEVSGQGSSDLYS